MFDHRSNPSLMNAILRLKSAVEELEQLGYTATVERVPMYPLSMGNTKAYIRVVNRYLRNHLNHLVPMGQEIQLDDKPGGFIIECDNISMLPRLCKVPQHWTPADLVREQRHRRDWFGTAKTERQ